MYVTNLFKVYSTHGSKPGLSLAFFTVFSLLFRLIRYHHDPGELAAAAAAVVVQVQVLLLSPFIAFLLLLLVVTVEKFFTRNEIKK